MTYVIRVQTTYPPADDIPDDICYPCVDDVHVMPGVVLHEIRQLRQEEGSRHLEQLCIKPTGLLVIFAGSLESANSSILAACSLS